MMMIERTGARMFGPWLQSHASSAGTISHPSLCTAPAPTAGSAAQLEQRQCNAPMLAALALSSDGGDVFSTAFLSTLDRPSIPFDSTPNPLAILSDHKAPIIHTHAYAYTRCLACQVTTCSACFSCMQCNLQRAEQVQYLPA
jgi:hypothetical protein